MIGTGSKDLANATLTEASVRSMAIESALAANDVASAHHICLDTLVPIARQRGTDQKIKDVIWQSCFQTARFHSYDSDSTPRQLTYIILEQKRTLLAIALEFCPATNIMDVLSVWTRINDELVESREAGDMKDSGYSTLLNKVDATGRDLLAVATRAVSRSKSSHGDDLRRSSGESERRQLEDVKDLVTNKLTSGIGWILGVDK